MIPESKPEKTDHGLLPKGENWFVVNMRHAVWRHVDGRGAVCLVLDDFENEPQAEQLGVNPFVLNPGEPMSMYHWEADQEDLLVVWVKQSWSSKVRSGRCARGTSCIARPRRST